MRILLFCLLLIWAFVTIETKAFNPNDMGEVVIEKAMPCGEYICALCSKDGERFIVVGVPHDGVFLVHSVYRIDGEKAIKVWDVTWKEV